MARSTLASTLASTTATAIAALFLALQPTPGWPHGESKPGPHGGVIQMPGGFHTELKLEGKRRVALYLLDMDWKNPVVAQSRAEATLRSAKGDPAVPLECKPAGRRFLCSLPRGVELRPGDRLEVKADRQDQKGIPVIYTYPFEPMKGTHFGH